MKNMSILVALVMTAVSCSSPAQTTRTTGTIADRPPDWPAPGGSLARTFRAQALELTAKPKIAWKQTISTNKDDLLREMLATKDRVFVVLGRSPSESNKDKPWRTFIKALRISDGKEVWGKEFPELAGVHSVQLSPQGKRLYITAEGGLFALDPGTGKLLWSKREDWNSDKLGGQVGLLVDEELVYITFPGSTTMYPKGEVAALEHGGEKLWQSHLALDGNVWLAMHGEVLLAASDGGEGITALDARSGDRLWWTRLPPEKETDTTRPGAAGVGFPSVIRNTILVATWEGLSEPNPRLNAFDLRMGKLLWKVDLPSMGGVFGVASDGRAIYLSCGHATQAHRGPGPLRWPRVLSFDVRTGKKLWESPTLLGFPHPPVLCGKTVLYFGGHFLCGLSAETGKWLWSIRFVDKAGRFGSIHSKLIVASGRVIVSEGHMVCALKPASAPE